MDAGPDLLRASPVPMIRPVPMAPVLFSQFQPRIMLDFHRSLTSNSNHSNLPGRQPTMQALARRIWIREGILAHARLSTIMHRLERRPLLLLRRRVFLRARRQLVAPLVAANAEDHGVCWACFLVRVITVLVAVRGALKRSGRECARESQARGRTRSKEQRSSRGRATSNII